MLVNEAIEQIEKAEHIKNLLDVSVMALGDDLTRMGNESIGINPEMAITISDICHDYIHILKKMECR